MKFIETHARAFLALIIQPIGTVLTFTLQKKFEIPIESTHDYLQTTHM